MKKLFVILIFLLACVSCSYSQGISKEEFENIKSCKAIHYGFNKDFDTTIQPRYNMVEYADDFGMDNLSKKGKNNDMGVNVYE